MKLSRQILVGIFSCSLSVFTANAQTFTKNLHKENGLPSNTVYSCTGDSRGYMWISTDKGLARYDGTESIQYSIDNGLSDNEVFRTFEDSKKRLWLITYNGEVCFIQNKRIYTKKNCDYLKPFTNTSFFTEIIEHNGQIYFFKRDNPDYYILSGKKVTTRTVPNGNMFLGAFLKDAELYFSTFKKISATGYQYYIHKASDTLHPVFTTVSENLYNHFLPYRKGLLYGGVSRPANELVLFYTSTWKDSDSKPVWMPAQNPGSVLFKAYQIGNNLILCTNGGAIIMNSALEFERTMLDGTSITWATSDFEGGLWLTTKNKGVFYFKNGTNAPLYNINNEISFRKQNPFDSSESILVSNTLLLRVKNRVVEEIPIPYEMGKNEPITDILYLDKSTLLIGNGLGLCTYNGSTFDLMKKHSGCKQFLLENDSVWIAKSHELVIMHVNQIPLQKNNDKPPYRKARVLRTLCVYRAADGRLLIGDNHGAYNLKKEEIVVPGVFSRINRITGSKAGAVAFCSDINGVFIQENRHVTNYTVKNGLISNYVSTAVFDSKNNIWVATHKGLSYINRTTKEITNYGISRNIPAEKINDITLLNDSTLLLATDRGLFTYTPASALTPQPPRVEIEWVKTNARERSANELLHLASEENDIEILLSGISFQNTDLEFYYQINDGKWNKVGSRLLTFIDMPTGTSQINVKCKNPFPQWSKTKSIQLYIAAPFYKTWWFMSGVALVTVLLLYFTFSYFRKRSK